LNITIIHKVSWKALDYIHQSNRQNDPRYSIYSCILYIDLFSHPLQPKDLEPSRERHATLCQIPNNQPHPPSRIISWFKTRILRRATQQLSSRFLSHRSWRFHRCIWLLITRASSSRPMAVRLANEVFTRPIESMHLFVDYTEVTLAQRITPYSWSTRLTLSYGRSVRDTGNTA